MDPAVLSVNSSGLITSIQLPAGLPDSYNIFVDGKFCVPSLDYTVTGSIATLTPGIPVNINVLCVINVANGAVAWKWNPLTGNL